MLICSSIKFKDLQQKNKIETEIDVYSFLEYTMKKYAYPLCLIGFGMLNISLFCHYAQYFYKITKDKNLKDKNIKFDTLTILILIFIGLFVSGYIFKYKQQYKNILKDHKTIFICFCFMFLVNLCLILINYLINSSDSYDKFQSRSLIYNIYLNLVNFLCLFICFEFKNTYIIMVYVILTIINIGILFGLYKFNHKTV